MSIKWTMIVEQQVMVWCTDGECKMQSELQIARQTINNLYVLHLHHLFPFLGFKAHGPFCWPYLTFSLTADVCNSKKVFWKGWKFYWSVFMSYRQQPYPLPAGTILWAAPQGSQANLTLQCRRATRPATEHSYDSPITQEIQHSTEAKSHPNII